MSGKRMTRDTFDAVVQAKMSRYRLSMDQAMSDTLRELEGPSTGRSMNDIDSGYRDKQRYSMHDLPHSSVDRSWEMDIRRESLSDLSYDLGREPSGGRNLNFLDKCVEPVGKEQLYREESNRHVGEFENLRSLNRGEFLSRDLRLPRSWELDRPLHGSENLRAQTQRLGNKPGSAENKASGLQGKIAAFDVPILKWAKFSREDLDSEFLKQCKTLFKEKTETCDMMVDCFKGSMTKYYRDMCFNTVSSVGSVDHPALKSPRIDFELLDLLMATKTVKAKNDFFEVIKPYDKDFMLIQTRVLTSAVPLVVASNTFELKSSFMTDPRELHAALKSTVSMCRKSIVLMGQTFALISNVRKNNILEALGVHDSSLNPSEYPNFKTSFIFGIPFITQLKTWLKNKENKLTLKSISKPTVNAVKAAVVKASKPEEVKTAKPEEVKTDSSSQGKAADPKAIATIDMILENAKKGNKVEKEKSPFWFLFDKGSPEYQYYRQKFIEFQKSKDPIQTQSTHKKKCKRSPEELACESVRAMLFARKAQSVKRRLYRTLAFSRKRKLAKLKSHKTKASPTVKVEKIIKDQKQDLEIIPITETKTENSACEIDVKSQETPDQCLKITETEKDEKLQEEKEPLPEGVDEKTRDTAVKLAEFVVQMGPEIEQFSMENSVNNPEFWFLREKDSPAFKFYKSKVKEFQQAEGVTSDEEIGLEDTDLEHIRTGDELQNDSDLEMDAECEAAEAPGAEVIPVAAFSQMPIPARPLVPRKRVANLKVGMLPPKRMCLVEEPKIHDPVRIEYERPPFRGFNRKKKPVDLTFANKKINQQNVGFQMLTKMGWQEGDGLGVRGAGIKNPIDVGTVSAGEGLGTKHKKAVNYRNCDEFRQRMKPVFKQRKRKNK